MKCISLLNQKYNFSWFAVYNWDDITLKYKIVKSSIVPFKVDAYNEYIFVAYIHISKHENSYRIYITNGETINKKTKRTIYLIDVKSKGLRDILRSIL